MSTIIGITGGIGSGKSVVSELLRVMGIKVFDCDKEAKNLMIKDKKIRQEINKLLGEEVIKDNFIDKQKIAKYLFSSEENKHKINSIVHPIVRKHFRKWVKANDKDRTIAVESAILFEANLYTEVDKIITVYAPKHIRISRVTKRDNTDQESVKAKIDKQIDEKEKINRSNFIIRNYNEHSVTKQIQKIIGSI